MNRYTIFVCHFSQGDNFYDFAYAFIGDKRPSNKVSNLLLEEQIFSYNPIALRMAKTL